MKNKLNLEWLYAAGIRAIKTTAQTALGMFTVGAALNEVQWQYILSVSAVAGIYSLLTSVATSLPEVGSDGTLQVNTADNQFMLVLNDQSQLTNLGDKKKVTFSIDKTTSSDKT